MTKYRKYTIDELDRLSVEDFQKSEKQPIVLVLDNIRSANNVGSVFRTGDAFRIQKIVLCGITSTPPNKEIHKTALGATDSVAWEYADNAVQAVERLKNQGYFCCAVEQAENSFMLNHLSDSGFSFPVALVFGNEVHGVQQEVIDACDCCLEIPQLGTKHSLNVAVSVGVVLWEILKTFSPCFEIIKI